MIKLNGISKVFDSRGIAGIHDLSLELQKGEIFAVMGPNGSGKSTLLNIIADQLKQDSGQKKLLGRCHLINDHKVLPEINVLKFLTTSVGLEVDEEKKIQLARDMADIFEFTFQLKQNISELSQGQKQKILLSSELINLPEIILMDEPFTHLDPLWRKQILNSLFKFIKQQSLSVLWVTHDQNEALRFSDKIGVMNFGRFEQIASPKEIVQRPKNLFVAQYLGYHNFILCQKDGDHWNTPWGKQQLRSSCNGTEGLLVIPNDAWSESPSLFEGTVLNICPQNLFWEIEFSWKDQIFVAHFPLANESVLAKKSLTLVPRWQDCFIIPL